MNPATRRILARYRAVFSTPLAQPRKLCPDCAGSGNRDTFLVGGCPGCGGTGWQPIETKGVADDHDPCPEA